MNRIFLILALASMLISCKGSFEAKNDRDFVRDVPADIEFKGGRRLSISGRTMAKVGSAPDAIAPLPGVSILAIVNGVSYTATSSGEGGWAVRDVPMRPNSDNTSISDDLPTVVIYFEKAGWSFDGDSVGAGNQNWKTVKIDAHDVDSTGNFHVDLGPLEMAQSALKVTSSLIKSSSALTGMWHVTGAIIGDAGQENEVYARDADTAITLTFNMPVDTSYNTNFVELYRPDGVPHAFTGGWDNTGTVYTIFPAAMSASNDDTARWQLRIARPVRAFNTAYATRRELENVSLQFQVLKSTRDNLLAAMAPIFYPQISGFVGYFFDAGGILNVGYSSGHNVTDVMSSDQTLCIQWNQNSLARSLDGYRIYSRAVGLNYGRWQNSTFNWLPITLTGDGKAHACNTNTYATIAGAATLSGANRFQLIVSPVDKDGNEGAISGVAVPLTIQDNWGPSIVGSAYSKTTITNQPDDFLTSSPIGKLTLTFSEALDPWTATQTTSFSALSGLLSSVTASNFKMLSATTADAQLTLNMRTLNTTLTRPARAGEDLINPVSIAGLRKGYVLKLMDPATNRSENKTISHIKSLDGMLELSSGLSNSYPSGAIVRLVQGESGHSTFLTSTTAFASKTANTLTVSNGSLFQTGQLIRIYLRDEEGVPTSLGGGTFTVASVTNTTIRLTAALGVNVPVGSTVADDAVTVAEPLPRGASSAFTPTSDLQWVGNTASTTLAIDNFSTTPDEPAQLNVILVSSVNNLSVDDVVVVGASDSVTANLSAKAIPTETSLSFSSHSFKVGDTVRVMPASIVTALGSRIASGATSFTASTAMTVVQNEPIVLSDPFFETALTAAAASGDLIISVSSSSGLAPGQTIVINSGVETAELRTISSISGTSVTLSGALTNAHGIGARVTRNALSETVTASGDVSASTAIGTSAATNNYSLTTSVTVSRNHADYAVSAIASGSVTISAIGAGVFYPSGTPVKLLSYPETRQITAINGNLLTLSTPLNYSHRFGATVVKPSQALMRVSTTDIGNWMVGDTIVCDSLAPVSNANNDRFEAVILAMDTESGYLTLNTTRASLTTTTNLSCVAMGDAIRVQGVLDANGQAIRTTWGNKTDLGATGAPR